MPYNCQTIRIGGSTAIVCGGKRPKRCAYCPKTSEVLCDFPVTQYKSGKKKGKWRTCDIPMCWDCTTKGVSNDVDFCRKHFPIAKAAYERKMSKVK